MLLKRVESSGHFETKWEASLYQHLSNKEKFSKVRDKIIHWSGTYLPSLKKMFVQSNGLCTLSLKKEDGLKPGLIPIFLECLKEVWGIECIYDDKTNKLTIFLKECSLPGCTSWNLNEKRKEWGALFSQLRKKRELIDFTIHCVGGEGKIVKSFEVHKAILCSRASALMGCTVDEIHLDVERSAFSLDSVKYLIKRLYLESPPCLDSIEKLIRYLRLLDHLQLEKEKKACEGMMIKWYERRLKDENTSQVLKEMDELAISYALPNLKSACAWLTIFDPAKLLCQSNWMLELHRQVEERAAHMHPIAKEAKWMKIKGQMIKFAATCFSILKSQFNGHYPVTFSSPIKSNYAHVFSHLAKEAWHLECVYDKLHRNVTFLSNSAYVPYPSFDSEEDDLASLLEKLDLHFQDALWGYSLKSLEELIKFIEESGRTLGKKRCEEMLIETFETLFLRAAEHGDEEKIAELLDQMEKLAEKNKLVSLEEKRKWLAQVSISKDSSPYSAHKIRKIE